MICSFGYTIHMTVHHGMDLITFLAGLFGRGMFSNAVWDPIFGNSSVQDVAKRIIKPARKGAGHYDV